MEPFPEGVINSAAFTMPVSGDTYAAGYAEVHGGGQGDIGRDPGCGHLHGAHAD